MSFKRAHLAVVLCALAAVGMPAAALAGADGAGPAARVSVDHTVTLKNFSFHPPTLSIHRGDSVTWLWRDGGIRHNVTGGSFRSRTQGSGSFTVRFEHTGTFNYRCTLHAAEGMRGKIIVH